MDLVETSIELKRRIIRLAHERGTTHIGCAVDCAEILTSLYFDEMRLDPWDARDIFILSKAHAAMVLYVALNLRGVLSDTDLAGYYINDGTLPDHTDLFTGRGIEVSGGSLGQGFSMGLGIAHGFKKLRSDRRVFVVIGDGENEEGTVWEGALFGSKLGLDNFTVIVDANNLQGYGRPTEICSIEPLADKWRAFGWDVAEIDGHCIPEIQAALKAPRNGAPRAIIARTTKGKGICYMEDKLEWHYYKMTDKLLAEGLDELS